MQSLLFSLSALGLVLVGIYGVLTRRNLVKILLALNILETGINLLLVAMGTFAGAAAPIVTAPVTSAAAAGMADPLPQALVLTSIVIGLGVTGLALTLTLRFYRRHGTLELDRARPVEDAEHASEAEGAAPDSGSGAGLPRTETRAKELVR